MKEIDWNWPFNGWRAVGASWLCIWAPRHRYSPLLSTAFWVKCHLISRVGKDAGSSFLLDTFWRLRQIIIGCYSTSYQRKKKGVEEEKYLRSVQLLFLLQSESFRPDILRTFPASSGQVYHQRWAQCLHPTAKQTWRPGGWSWLDEHSWGALCSTVWDQVQLKKPSNWLDWSSDSSLRNKLCMWIQTPQLCR